MVTRSKRKIKKKGIVAIILEVNATSQSLIPCNQRDKFLSKKKDEAFLCLQYSMQAFLVQS